jgi:hypothetical protein
MTVNSVDAMTGNVSAVPDACRVRQLKTPDRWKRTGGE